LKHGNPFIYKETKPNVNHKENPYFCFVPYFPYFLLSLIFRHAARGTAALPLLREARGEGRDEAGILPQLGEFCLQQQEEIFGKLQMHCSEFH
jgi:hypothetical protein